MSIWFAVWFKALQYGTRFHKPSSLNLATESTTRIALSSAASFQSFLEYSKSPTAQLRCLHDVEAQWEQPRIYYVKLLLYVPIKTDFIRASAARLASAMALDTRNADNSAWLVKVPYALASVWKAACDQSMAGQVDDTFEGPSSLGRIVTEPAAEESNNVSFLELPEAMLAEGIPRRFKLQLLPLPPGESNKMHVVSYEVAQPPPAGATGSGGSQPLRELLKPRVDAAIHQRMDMVPMVQDDTGEWVLDAEYLKLIRSRTEQAAEKVRVVGYYEDNVDNVLADLAQQKRVERDISARRKATVAAAKADNMKRPRLEKDELEELLFRLFERNSAWAFKSLITETRQPHMHLKAVLEGIAAQQKRGPNKDKYELKPEYRSKSSGKAAMV